LARKVPYFPKKRQRVVIGVGDRTLWNFFRIKRLLERGIDLLKSLGIFLPELAREKLTKTDASTGNRAQTLLCTKKNRFAKRKRCSSARNYGADSLLSNTALLRSKQSEQRGSKSSWRNQHYYLPT
jgi:hypothetical protein